MSEVTKKSDNSSSQMRLLGDPPHMCLQVYIHYISQYISSTQNSVSRFIYEINCQ